MAKVYGQKDMIKDIDSFRYHNKKKYVDLKDNLKILDSMIFSLEKDAESCKDVYEGLIITIKALKEKKNEILNNYERDDKLEDKEFKNFTDNLGI